MKYIAIVIVLVAMINSISAQAAGSVYKAIYPKNDQAHIFPEGYFKKFSETHPIR